MKKRILMVITLSVLISGCISSKTQHLYPLHLQKRLSLLRPKQMEQQRRRARVMLHRLSIKSISNGKARLIRWEETIFEASIALVLCISSMIVYLI